MKKSKYSTYSCKFIFKGGILDENLLADTSNGLEEALLRVDLALARILLTGGFQDLGEYCPLELEVTSRKCAAKMHGLRSSIAPIVERRRLRYAVLNYVTYPD